MVAEPMSMLGGRGEVLRKEGGWASARTPRGMSPDTSARSVIRDTRGASLVEYLILVGAVSLTALGAAMHFGTTVDQKIRCLASAVTGNGGSCTSASSADPSGGGTGDTNPGFSGVYP